MELKEFQSLVNKITQNLDNQALVTEIFTTILDDYTQMVDTHTTLSNSLSQKEEEINNLQKTNMNLFLKVSNPAPDQALQKAEPLKYEDLIKSMEG